MDNKKYFVFISYSSKDNEDDNKWAEWLRHELDHWHLPTTYHGRKPVQENLREVFRDRDGFCAGKEWDKQVEPILKESQNLIVICSPNAAKSEAVNKEVEFFINQGKEYSIFPFIVEGDCPAECFPRALKHSIVGGDVNKDGGRDAAFIKVVAGMLGVDFSDLYNRYELDKAEQERIEHEKKEKLQISQSRFLAEKANSLVAEGDSYTASLLALESLPINDPERPFVPEAEAALRYANRLHPGISLATIDSGTNYNVNCVSFSPNGKLIATGITRYIKIWDVLSGALVVEIPENDSAIETISFNPNGNQIAFGDRRGYVGIVDISSGTVLKREKIGVWINSISYNPNGQQIAICSKNRTYVWDTKTYSLCFPIIEHEGSAFSVSYSQDGKYLLTSSEDRTAKIWDSQTGCLLKVYKDGHSEAIECATFSPNGKRVLTGSNDHTAIIWDLESESVIQILPHDFCVESAVFHKDGLHVITADKNVKIWNLDTNKYDCYDFPVNNTNSLALSSDGYYLAVASKWNIRIIQLKQDQLPIVCKTGDMDLRRGFASFYPDGNKIVSIDNQYGRIRIWDARNGTLLKTKFTEHKKYIQTIYCSQDGKHIITSSYDGLIKIWDAETLSFLFEIKGEYQNEKTAVFSPDNQFILTASGKTPKIWNKENGCIKVLGKDSDIDVNSAYYDQTGKNVVAAYRDGTIKIWNIDTEECVRVLGKTNGHLGPVSTAVFNPLGTQIASASSDCTIKIWDANTGECLSTLKGHLNAVETVFFNPKGNLLISSSVDRTIKIWDVATGVLLDTLEGHTGIVNSAFFNKDGDKIVSAAHDGTVRIWNFLSLQALVKSTKERFINRQLMQEERKKYYLE